MRTVPVIALLLTLAASASAESPAPDAKVKGEELELSDPEVSELLAAAEREARARFERSVKELLGTDEIRTPSSTWSAGGWGKLRWGMGFLDVIDAIDDEDPENEVVKMEERDGSIFIAFRYSLHLYGEPILVAVRLQNYRLSGVMLTPDNKDPAARAKWVERARGGLRIKYGEPLGDDVALPWIIDDRTKIHANPANGAITYDDWDRLLQEGVDAVKAEIDEAAKL